MRNCREITALVSQGLDKKLALRERFAVWLHVSMCSSCRNFQKQTRFIHKLSDRYTNYLKHKLEKNANHPN